MKTSICFLFFALFLTILSITIDPPGPIDNGKIAITKCGNAVLKQGRSLILVHRWAPCDIFAQIQ